MAFCAKCGGNNMAGDKCNNCGQSAEAASQVNMKNQGKPLVSKDRSTGRFKINDEVITMYNPYSEQIKYSKITGVLGFSFSVTAFAVLFFAGAIKIWCIPSAIILSAISFYLCSAQKRFGPFRLAYIGKIISVSAFFVAFSALLVYLLFLMLTKIVLLI